MLITKVCSLIYCLIYLDIKGYGSDRFIAPDNIEPPWYIYYINIFLLHKFTSGLMFYFEIILPPMILLHIWSVDCAGCSRGPFWRYVTFNIFFSQKVYWSDVTRTKKWIVEHHYCFNCINHWRNIIIPKKKTNFQTIFNYAYLHLWIWVDCPCLTWIFWQSLEHKKFKFAYFSKTCEMMVIVEHYVASSLKMLILVLIKEWHCIFLVSSQKEDLVVLNTAFFDLKLKIFFF